MIVTPLYASLLAFLFVFLSIRVIKARRAEKVALGDGDSLRVRRAMRVQANFAEYVPLALLLIALAELQGLPVWALHLLGLVLLIGRGFHAYGVSQESETFKYRVRGMGLTFGVIVTAAVANLGAVGWALIA